ncbi:MAG: hypothetical protein AAF408_10885 [Pseudomonadota bacterium]
MFDGLYLTPLSGATLVFVAVVCGHRFRLAWKEQTAGWARRAWIFGIAAGVSLCALAFLPFRY